MPVEDDLDPELAALPEVAATEEEETRVASIEEIQGRVASNGVSSSEQPVRGRRPHKRRGHTPSAPRGVASPPKETQVGAPSAQEAPVARPSRDDGTKSALVVWANVLEEQRTLGVDPSGIGIRVQRIPTGPQKQQAVDLSPIDGSMVCGSDGGQGPAEALYDWIVNFYHMGFSGPALYRLTFYYRYPGAGRGNIPGVAELSLDHPERIRAQAEMLERAKYAQALQGGSTSFGSLPASMQRGPFGFPSFLPAQAQAPQPPPSQAPSGMTEKDIRELRNSSAEAAYLKGIMAGRADAAAGAPPPAPPQAPVYDPRLPPAGLSADEWERLQEERASRGVAKAVAQTLTAMGFTPQTAQGLQLLQNPQALQQVLQPMIQQPQAAQPLPDPLAALKNAFEMFQGYVQFQKKMTEALPGMLGGTPGAPAAEGVEPPEIDPFEMKPVAGGVTFPGTAAPMMFSPKLDDESHLEYFIRLGVANPNAAQAILGWAAKVLDPKTLNELIQAFAARAGGKKQAAPPTGQAPTRQMGWQAAGGAPPSAPPSAPQAPGGWIPRA